MRKLVLIIIALILILPLTMHGSGAYFFDSKDSSAEITSGGDSGLYHYWISSEGSSYSIGAGLDYEVNIPDIIKPSRGTSTSSYVLGCIIAKSPNLSLSFSLVDGEGGDYGITALDSSPCEIEIIWDEDTGELELTLKLHSNHSTPGMYQGYIRVTDSNDIDDLYPIQVEITQ